jgi:hypothetical protein
MFGGSKTKMADWSVTELAKLTERIADAGLKATASLLKRVFGDRSPKDHQRWDRETRSTAQAKVVEALAEGIHTPPKEGLEIPIADLRTVKNLPPLDGGRLPDASSNTEIKALEAAGAVRVEGQHVLVPDPPRLISGLRSLLAEDSIWVAFGHQIGKPDLFQATILPVKAALQRITTYDTVLKLYSHLAFLYGVRVRTIPVSEIYKGAAAFVSRAGSATALTNATSAGAIDPTERAGTAEVLAALGLEDDEETRKKLKKKDSWRIQNFRDGLLNPDFPARRPYFFDSVFTVKSILETLQALPEDCREKYKDMAARHLVETVSCPGVELYKVKQFAPWMWRLTRSAPGHVLISLRHPQTRAIDEGLELNFDNPQKVHEFYQIIFGVAAGLAGLSALPPLALASVLAGVVEWALFRKIDSRLLYSNAERDMSSHSERVKLSGTDPESRLLSARRYIDLLLAEGNA